MLNNIQERVERSIYEAIRLVLVEEGYTPDINARTYTRDQWTTALTNIAKGPLGFSIELFGHSSGQDKGTKEVPRISIIPRRIMPGDIGTEGHMGFELGQDGYYKRLVDLNSVNLHIDINLASANSKQDRILNAILAKSIGQRRYITFYDNPDERFLIQQFSYYDLPDVMEGIEEKAFSYEVKDIWMYNELSPVTTAKIEEITISDNQQNETKIPE